jgi:hypothetical protein
MLIRLSKEFAFLLHVGHGLPIMRLIAHTCHKICRTGVTKPATDTNYAVSE